MLMWNYFKWRRDSGGELSVMDTTQTLEYIKRNQCSVCRYGDGEFDLIRGKKGIGFQDNNRALSERLKNILVEAGKVPEILVCIPYVLTVRGREGLSDDSILYWNNYISKFPYEIYAVLYGKKYGDSQITRPYIRFEKNEKNYENAKNIFSSLKEVWNYKRVLIVEGRKSRLGVGNDLFGNTKAVRRILCPEKNAWSRYDEILFRVLSVSSEYDVILIALGPTATVLAYDLGKSGLWSIDIGHLDVEYEWFLDKAQKKEPIKNKYVNEVSSFVVEDEILDDEYCKQIIYEIK